MTILKNTNTVSIKRTKKVISHMNMILCDDNPVFLRQLTTAIEHHCARRDWVCHITNHQHPKDTLKADLSSIQIVFLDIDMPEINGMDVARQLRLRYPDLIIVFITGFIEYAPDGYDVNAFRYLLKPEFETKLPRCLDDIWEKLYVSQESIRIQQPDQSLKVRLKDILYIEGTPHRHVLLHTLTSPNNPLECLGKLSDFDAKLAGKGFLRIQKSFLVNMWHISDIRNYSAIMDNGEELNISRTNYSRICEDFTLWEGQRL